MFIVYALYNEKHGKTYIGQTANLPNRLKLHNQGTFKNSYTSHYNGEWRLIYSEEYATRSDALVREKQLKSYRGREFLKNYSGVAQR